MGPTIREVKIASLKIMDIVFSKPTTPIEDIVLVTFNDPSKYLHGYINVFPFFFNTERYVFNKGVCIDEWNLRPNKH